MPPKDSKKGIKTTLTEKSSLYDEFEEVVSPRSVSLSLVLEGDGFGPGEWNFLTIFHGQVIIETKWHDNLTLNSDSLSIDLKQPFYQNLIAEQPLLFIIRVASGKGVKEPDPLLNPDNRAGATVDLFPLTLGEEQIFLKVPIINIITGISTGCAIVVTAKANGASNYDRIPLILTMISCNCLPTAKEGTVYLSAIGLSDIQESKAINFNMSSSTFDAKKVLWASVSNGGLAANTAFNTARDDKFISDDIELKESESCTSAYWNAMTRVLVDPDKLRQALTSTFLVEIAGVPRVGKIDVRGRYMAFVDAGVLLEPGQFGVTSCAKLLYYNEAALPEGSRALLELPPTSAKISARETDFVIDEYGHPSYIIIKFDLYEPLNSKAKTASLYEIIGFPSPEGCTAPINELYAVTVPDDGQLDVRRLRKEGWALAVHKELSSLACRGKLQMNQSIKRTAANRLLLRLKSMIKQFPPEEHSFLEWQDTVTAQHAACRRAVTSSFKPQTPLLRSSSRIAAARSRLAGDIRIAEEHIRRNLIATPQHPRPLLSMVLRCFEKGNISEARNYLLRALSVQTRNRYLLWTFGGLGYNEQGSYEVVAAAFRIAVKGDTSDGTTGAIGWAALHALHHYNKNIHAAFVAVRKMRKSYELPREWKKFLLRWVETSGEEEIFWLPGTLDFNNPMLIASAFFLCLRCYKFSERILQCVEEGCVTKGSRYRIKNKITVDIYYIRAASLVLQDQIEKALNLTDEAIRKFGPSALMSQMRATCLTCARGWDGDCETALLEADRAGSEPCASLLLRGAVGALKNDPIVSLQRAARAHKIAPSAHSALIISRIYAKMGEESLAERWAAAAVKTEPLLADGWVVLAMLAIYDRYINKARSMLRTAKQVGPISNDIKEELRKLMKIVPVESLPDSLVKDLCLCEYY